MNLPHNVGCFGAIPIYAVDMSSAEAVKAFMDSSQIQNMLQLYGAVQLRQTPPIPGWDEPEETLNRVKEFLHNSPSFSPHGQWNDGLRNSDLTWTTSP